MCECNILIETEIYSYEQFEKIKDYFEQGTQSGLFSDAPVKRPHYVGRNMYGKKVKWFADKWYRCNCCNTLWEFIYPDFPAVGKIRRISD